MPDAHEPGTAAQESAPVRHGGLSRAYSLKRNKEFRYVYRNGKSKVYRSVVLIYKQRGNHLPKIGFSVSKKIGNSVTRNRVKRRMRAALAPLLPDIKPGSRLIFIARPSILSESFQCLCDTFAKLLERAELICGTQNKAPDNKRMGE